MTSAFGWLTRFFVLAILLVPPTISPQPGGTSGETPVAGAEVRLRKLHLVRPDLIPYPIAYEVCC